MNTFSIEHLPRHLLPRLSKFPCTSTNGKVCSRSQSSAMHMTQLACPNRKLHLPFKPQGTGTTRQEVKVTKDGRACVFRVEKLVHKHVHRRPKGVQRKVPHILRKYEQRKRRAERQVRERRVCSHSRYKHDHCQRVE